jgi:hypothetical protein
MTHASFAPLNPKLAESCWMDGSADSADAAGPMTALLPTGSEREPADEDRHLSPVHVAGNGFASMFSTVASSVRVQRSYQVDSLSIDDLVECLYMLVVDAAGSESASTCISGVSE